VTIQLELWQFISLIVAVIGAFWAMAKVIARQIGKHLDLQDARLATLEKTLNALQVEMARDYVRRDDYIRDIGSLSNQFQNLAISVERMFREVGRETLQMIRQEVSRK
jgi:hypothetical protein